jgi:hypothetical protein
MSRRRSILMALASVAMLGAGAACNQVTAPEVPELIEVAPRDTSGFIVPTSPMTPP